MSYWVAVVACPVAIYWIFSMKKGLKDAEEQKVGNVSRTFLAITAVLIFGFTIWEGRD